MSLSNNNMTVTLEMVREAVGRSSKKLSTPRTLPDVKEVLIVEQKLAAGATAVEINFGPILSADALIVFTPKPVGLHINGAGAEEVECGSMFMALDTDVTSLHIDNDLLTAPGEDVTVEIWLVALTD